MDLENIKNIWEKEEISETPEISLEQQKEIHLPLEKIRKNMRHEFWGTVVIFVSIILFFVLADFHFFKFKVYIITLVSSMLLVTAFYFFKFFNLYKNISSINLKTLESLKDLNFQFKLNEQYYLAFYIVFVPFVICEMLLVFEFVPPLKSITGLPFIAFFLGSCLFLLTTLYLGGTLWFKNYYGKYIKQIQQITDDLK